MHKGGDRMLDIALINKQSKKCENIAVFENMQTAIDMFGQQYILAEPVEGYWIGDIYKDGNWSKSSPPPRTDEEKQVAYDELSIQYIHDRYSYDDENKIMREYLADMENAKCKVAFEAYNNYVTECKQKAYKEIYGE